VTGGLLCVSAYHKGIQEAAGEVPNSEHFKIYFHDLPSFEKPSNLGEIQFLHEIIP
jgi:hypothetical protein